MPEDSEDEARRPLSFYGAASGMGPGLALRANRDDS
jgi:hypothetical protein